MDDIPVYQREALTALDASRELPGESNYEAASRSFDAAPEDPAPDPVPDPLAGVSADALLAHQDTLAWLESARLGREQHALAIAAQQRNTEALMALTNSKPTLAQVILQVACSVTISRIDSPGERTSAIPHIVAFGTELHRAIMNLPQATGSTRP